MATVSFRDPAGTVRPGAWRDDRVSFAGRTYDLEEVSLLAPCAPTKLVCIGRNYAARADELGEELPDRPLLFLKPPSAVAAPRRDGPAAGGEGSH